MVSVLRSKLLYERFCIVFRDHERELWVHCDNDLLRVTIDHNQNKFSVFCPLLDKWIPIVNNCQELIEMINKLERYIELTEDVQFDSFTVSLMLIGKHQDNVLYIVPSVVVSSSITEESIVKAFDTEFVKYILESLNDKLGIDDVLRYTSRIMKKVEEC